MPSRIPQSSFIINNPQESKTLSKIFVANPSISQERKIGKIFSLIENSARDEFNQKIINLIINEAQNNYYTLENLDTNKPLEDLFEDFLYQLNQKIHHLIQEEKILFDLGKINVIIGTIQPEYTNKKIIFNIHFSQVGGIEMMLIQKIGYKNYKLTQVNKSQDTDISKPNPFKFFFNLVSGKLAQDDYLILCNYAILDYISLDKLKNSAVVLSPDKLIAHFKTLLVEVDEKIPFSFIIFNLHLEKDYFEESEAIKIESIPTLAPTKITIPQDQKIIQIATFPTKIKKSEGLLAKLFQKPRPILKEETLPTTQAGPLEKVKPKYSFWQKLKWLWKRIFKPIKTTKELFALEKPARDRIIERWSEQKIKKIDTKITGLKKIPLFNKALLVFGLLFVILFIGSLFILNQKQKREQTSEQLTQLIAQIEEKKSLIESNLIYNDEIKAKQNLKEAETLLKKLPQNNPQEQQQYEKLAAEIKAIDQKLKHLVNILESSPFMDFAKELSSSSINHIIEYQGNLYAWQSQDNKIYQINLTKKSISQINYPALKAGKFKNATKYDASAKAILFHHADNKLTKLNLANQTLTPQEIQLPAEAAIADLEIYNNKLYLVDTKNKQIYKYLITEAGFTNQKPWLVDKNIDLTNTISLAIDSNVYLLKNNGQVLKFYTGKLQNWGLKNLEPTLTQPTKVYTSVDDNYIYILEPKEQRLVIIDKNGALIIQYYCEKFSALKDFVVMEKAKKIYLFNDQQLYQLNMDFIK
jgi:hypothetical protein